MKKQNKQKAFSLIEIIAAVAIIGLLLGLLVPALTMVHEKALNVKQKAQLNSISIALEAFKNDSKLGDYPPSYLTSNSGNVLNTGAHKLAEALIGRDGFGFNPYTDWSPTDYTNGGDAGAVQIYGTDTGSVIDLDARKGPYLEIETMNAFNLIDIYQSVSNLQLGSNTVETQGFVLTDVYEHFKDTTTGLKGGLPILYYKADTAIIKNDPDNHIPFESNTYNWRDNRLVQLNTPYADWTENPFAYSQNFYRAILNPKFPPPPGKPYKADSFILISAGPDALYGTADDIFNFDKPQD